MLAMTRSGQGPEEPIQQEKQLLPQLLEGVSTADYRLQQMGKVKRDVSFPRLAGLGTHRCQIQISHLDAVTLGIFEAHAAVQIAAGGGLQIDFAENPLGQWRGFE